MLTPLGYRNQFRCYSQRRSLVDSVRGIFCFVLPFPSCFFPPPLLFPRSPEPSSPIEQRLCLTAAAIDSHPRWDTFFFYLLSVRRQDREPAHCKRNGLDCVLYLPLIFLIFLISLLSILLCQVMTHMSFQCIYLRGETASLISGPSFIVCCIKKECNGEVVILKEKTMFSPEP